MSLFLHSGLISPKKTKQTMILVWRLQKSVKCTFISPVRLFVVKRNGIIM